MSDCNVIAEFFEQLFWFIVGLAVLVAIFGNPFKGDGK